MLTNLAQELFVGFWLYYTRWGLPIKKRAVFLDRDGVIIEDTGYPGAVGSIMFITSAPDAIKLLNEHDYLVFVVTNQSAVARGFINEEDLTKTNNDISSYFLSHGAKIDAFYCCPHFPEGTIKKYAIHCDCRKPKPGLINQAVNDYNIDPSISYFIGDSITDVQAAISAMVSPILVNNENIVDGGRVPSFRNLYSAVNYIIEKRGCG